MSIILIFLSLLSLAKADDFKPLAEHLNSITRGLNLNPTKPDCLWGYEIDPSKEKTIYYEEYAPSDTYKILVSCLHKVCERIDETEKNSLAQGMDLYNSSSDDEKKIKLFKKNLALMIRELEKLNTDAKKWSANLKNSQDNLYKSEILDSAIVTYLIGNIFYDSSSIDPHLGFTEKQLQSIENSYSPTLGKAVTQKVIQRISTLSKNPRIGIIGKRVLGAPYRYLMQYPDLNFQDAVMSDLDDTLKKIKALPPVIQDALNQNGLSRALIQHKNTSSNSTQGFNELDGQKVMELTDKINLIYFTAQGVDNHEIASPLISIISKADKSDKNKVDERLSDGIENKPLRELIPNLSPDKINDIYKSCVWSIASSQTTLPNSTEIAEFNKNLANYKNKISKSIFGRYSRVSQQILMDKIDSTRVFVPPSANGYIENVTSYFEQEMKQAQAIRGIGNKNSADGIGLAVLAYPGSDDFLGNRLTKMCESLSFRPVRDNAVSDLGAISMGSQSIQDREFGASVLAHEFGHIFQSTLKNDPQISGHSRGILLKQEACLKNLHQPFLKKMTEFNFWLEPKQRAEANTDKYLSEDYSDMISAGVEQSNNFICNLVPQGMMWGSNGQDEHSTLVFRVLHVEMASRRIIPRECQEFINKSGYSLKACFNDNSKTQ